MGNPAAQGAHALVARVNRPPGSAGYRVIAQDVGNPLLLPEPGCQDQRPEGSAQYVTYTGTFAGSTQITRRRRYKTPRGPGRRSDDDPSFFRPWRYRKTGDPCT